ncbi:hypothetical protein [Deinococcus sp. PEB2-63]
MARLDDQAGAAARAGAENSVSDELLNITAEQRAYPQTPGELRAERRTRKQDFEFFARHPHRESYVRRYQQGELAVPVLIARCGGRAPSHVAVGYACPGERVRVYIWPGHDHTLAKRHAEQAAEQRRVELGMKGRA